MFGKARLSSTAFLITAIVSISSVVLAQDLMVQDLTAQVSPDSLGLTDIELRDRNASLSADFYAPAPLLDKMSETREVTWVLMDDSPENLTRFSFGVADTSDVFAAVDTDNYVDAELAVEADLAAYTAVSNDLLLRSMFQFVEVARGQYAIYSTKHGNYALDVADDSDSLILRDVRSLDAYNSGSASFLTFSVTGSPLTLVAEGRYFLDTPESAENDTLLYESDRRWRDREVMFDGAKLLLTEDDGTAMNLYEATIGLEIPFDFNPEQWSRFDNLEYYNRDQTRGNIFASGIPGLDPKYADQTSAPGVNPETLSAAQKMLDQIDMALVEQGSQTRYPQEFYLALRDGMLRRVLLAEESTDGTIGEPTVPYIYFTNEADAQGDYHPFMVIATRGAPEALALLGDVAHPPGDGTTRGYDDQKVTRSYHMENFLWRIPMRDYGEVDEIDENDLSAISSLASDMGVTTYDHHNYASINENALAVDGVLVFPSYNNTLQIAQENAELSVRGMHAGRGLGVHYHADPHSAALTHDSDNTDTGLNLYNETDYLGHDHPPIISIGFDGVAGYGFYLDGDTSSHGVDVSLDDFGGHEHEDYGYHYHSLRTDRQVAGKSIDYISHELGPLGAWAGRINYVADFMQARRGFGSGITTFIRTGTGPNNRFGGDQSDSRPSEGGPNNRPDNDR